MKPASLAEEIAKLERRARVLTPVLGSDMPVRTTLLNELLAERAEMLRLLVVARDAMRADAVNLKQVADTITTFLATRTACKETR
jgi:hypothetical protein